MKRLFFGLSFAAMALFVACGGDSGSSADSLDESSSSSEMDGAESSDSEDLNSNGSEGNEGESSGSEGGESSGSGEGSSASVPGGSSDASVYDAMANTLTDLRDGQVYKTSTIDIPSKNYSEVWMAENLNFVTDNSWCYDNDPANCAKYGRLYTWAAAVGWAEDEYIRGVCPKGWHLPSLDEWAALIVAVDGSITEYTSSNTVGSKLKSVTGWKAHSGITNEDAFGFSALPAGRRYDNGYYDGEGDFAFFWSSTEYYSNSAYYMCLHYGYDRADLYRDDNKYFGFSVRCLKD